MPVTARSSVPFMSIAIGVAALTAASAPSLGFTAENSIHPDSAAIAAVVGGFHKALTAGDSVAALAFLAEDVTILESGGVETRAEYRSHHLSSDISFAKAVASTRAKLKVTVYGNTAWTSSTSETRGQYNGRAINSVGAESMVLTRARGGWKIRSIHWSSRAKRPAA